MTFWTKGKKITKIWEIIYLDTRTFQYVYSNFYPEIYCSTERRGFDLKSNFRIIFKTYKDKIKMEASLRKNPHNYEEIRDEACVCEQKPIEIDDFNENE